MKTKKVEFKNKEGVKISAKLELPVDSKPSAFAIFAHCFTCSKDLSAVSNISRALSLNGIAVLRFDFTGLGESEGDFEETTFKNNISDLIAASEFLEEEYIAPKILIGHSLGGAAVLIAANKISSVKAVTTISAPYDPAHVKKVLKEDINEIKEKGEATVSIGGRPFKIKKQFLDDIEEVDPEENLKKLKRALLIMHSPQDLTVPIENAADIYKAAKHPKSFISLDDADHLISNKKDSIYAGEIISSWAKKYIDVPEVEPLSSEKKVVVRTTDSYTTEVKAGNHSFLSDEPESVGGNDFGPTPYDLLTAGLGTCTSMTLRMYADRKKWDLKEVKVHLQHSKIHAEDCEDCKNKSSKIDKIERIIEVVGDLDEDQKKRLVEIADKCPVHKTLHSDINVETKLFEED